MDLQTPRTRLKTGERAIRDSPGEQPLSELLVRVRDGDRAASEAFFDAVYGELRRLARSHLRRESGRPLQTTELVHEAYLRLWSGGAPSLEDRAHFFGAAARAMRRILIDQFRRRQAAKRGGGEAAITLDEELLPGREPGEVLLAVDGALSSLENLNPRLSQVVEYRFFAGLSEREIAELLGLSERTVRSDWRKARAWLARELDGGGHA